VKKEIFEQTLLQLYFGTNSELANLVFEMLDVDKQNLLNLESTKLVVNHMLCSNRIASLKFEVSLPIEF